MRLKVYAIRKRINGGEKTTEVKEWRDEQFIKAIRQNRRYVARGTHDARNDSDGKKLLPRLMSSYAHIGSLRS